MEKEPFIRKAAGSGSIPHGSGGGFRGRPDGAVRRGNSLFFFQETAQANAEVVGEAVRKAVTVGIGVAGGKCDARSSQSSMLAAARARFTSPRSRDAIRVCGAAESPSLMLVRPAG
jgi:hypothetical protein